MARAQPVGGAAVDLGTNVLDFGGRVLGLGAAHPSIISSKGISARKKPSLQWFKEGKNLMAQGRNSFSLCSFILSLLPFGLIFIRRGNA